MHENLTSPEWLSWYLGTENVYLRTWFMLQKPELMTLSKLYTWFNKFNLIILISFKHCRAGQQKMAARSLLHLGEHIFMISEPRMVGSVLAGIDPSLCVILLTLFSRYSAAARASVHYRTTKHPYQDLLILWHHRFRTFPTN